MLRQLREQNGLTSAFVANKIGIDVSYLTNIECGNQPLSKRNRKLLANFYGVTEDEIQDRYNAQKKE